MREIKLKIMYYIKRAESLQDFRIFNFLTHDLQEYTLEKGFEKLENGCGGVLIDLETKQEYLISPNKSENEFLLFSLKNIKTLNNE